MTQPATLLFLYDMENAVFLEEGMVPYTTYSHFTHLFLIAHEAQRMGWRVYFKSTDEAHAQEIRQVYPTTELGEKREYLDPAFKPDMIFCVNTPGVLAEQRHFKPDATGVYVLSSHFWLEKEIFRPDFAEWLRVSVSNDVDFILTQNPRMEDLMFYLSNLLARWIWRDRILSAPNTFCRHVANTEAAMFDRASVRKRMNARDDEIIIINSGGPWSWTDTDTFATAFAEVLREGAQRLRFAQMGIMQDNNNIQNEIIPFWQNYLQSNQDLIQSGRLMVFTNWREASSLLPAWNYGADLGLNVSRDSTENYQAHRVRFIDYAKAGLPVLNSTGNYYATYDARDATMMIEPGNVQAYKNLLWQLERGEIDLTQKRAAMADFRESLMSEKLIPPVLEHMLRAGRIPADQRAGLKNMWREIYQQIIDHRFVDKFK